jgi:hypothetical protein
MFKLMWGIGPSDHDRHATIIHTQVIAYTGFNVYHKIMPVLYIVPGFHQFCGKTLGKCFTIS